MKQKGLQGAMWPHPRRRQWAGEVGSGVPVQVGGPVTTQKQNRPFVSVATQPQVHNKPTRGFTEEKGKMTAKGLIRQGGGWLGSHQARVVYSCMLSFFLHFLCSHYD